MRQRTPMAQFQIGKAGLTEGTIESLKTYFKTHFYVRVSVLPSATRNKEELKKLNEDLLKGLGKNYTSRIIGYTLVVKRWRKDKREE
jgi:RNA-binding protein YhbY